MINKKTLGMVFKVLNLRDGDRTSSGSVNRINEYRSSQKNSKKGFTLVELIVVLVIIAILAAVAIPALLGYVDYSRKKSFVMDANAALKATQATINEVYNDSGIVIDEARRDKAWHVAGVDEIVTDIYTDGKGYSKFKVWTIKKIDSNTTTATTDNLASYTVKYAQYNVPTKYGDYALLYNGSEWEVFDNEEKMSESDTYTAIMSSYSENLVCMWPHVPGEGTAWNDKIPATTPWQEREQETETSEVTVELIGYKLFEHGLVFENGSNIKDSITVKITRDSSGNITKPWSGGAWVNANNKIISSDGKTVYTIKMDEGDSSPFVFTDRWYINDFGSSERCTLDELVSKTEFVGRLFSNNNNKITKLYADAYLPYETRTVTFKAYNKETLLFTEENGKDRTGSVSVSFRKYKCNYEGANAFNLNEQSLIDENGKIIGACDWKNIPDNAKVLADTDEKKYGYSLSGWALSMAGSESTYEKNDDKLKSYEGLPDIWNRIFAEGVSKDTAETYIFTGIVKQTKQVVLLPGQYATFKNNINKIELNISTLELTNTTESDFDKYTDETDLYPVFQEGRFRQKGWILTDVDGTAKEEAFNDRNLAQIQHYVIESDEGIKFTFEAENVEGSRTKFVPNTQSHNTTEHNFCGQIAKLNGGVRNANLVEFSKKEYSSAISLLTDNGLFSKYQIIDNLGDDDLENDTAVKCKNHYRVITGVNTPITDSEFNVSGTLTTFIVFWDGDDKTYYVPSFGYSIKDSNGKNHAFWFSRDDSPELNGNFKHMFLGMSNVDFSKSCMGDWNTSTCTNMSSMFENSSLNTDDFANQINKWDFSSVETIQSMFNGCVNLTEVNFSGKTMNKLNKVTDVFKNCPNLDTVMFTTCHMESITSLDSMFGTYSGDSSTNIKYFYAKEWDIRSVKSLKGMFARGVNSSYNGNVSSRRPYSETVNVDAGVDLNTSVKNKLLNDLIEAHIYNTNDGAYSATATTSSGKGKLIIANFTDSNIESVTDMQSMFSHCPELKQVSFENTDLSKVEDMSQMFWHCFKLEKVSFKNIAETHPVKFYRIFDMCISLQTIELDLVFDETEQRIKTKTLMTDRVTDMRNVFYSCISLSDTYYSYFDFSSCEYARRMLFAVEFKNADGSYKPINFENVNMPNLENAEHLFGQVRAASISLNGCNFGKLTKATGMFNYVDLQTPGDEKTKITMDDCNMSSLGNPSQLFQCFSGDNSRMQEFSGKNWNVSSATSIENLFNNQKSLEVIDLEGSNFGSVTNTKNLFNGCDRIETIILSNCDMHSLTGVYSFNNTDKSLKYFYADKWDIRNVKSLENFFNYSSIGQRELKEVDFTGAKLDSVTSMKLMFGNCDKLDTVTGLDTIEVTSLKYTIRMFANCKSLQSVSMNICSEGMADKQLEMNEMFDGCSKLTSISFVGLKNEDRSVDVNQISKLTHFINGCTQYDKDALEATLSNWNFNTDIAITGNGELFKSYKSGDGYNTLFKEGQCHDSFNSASSKIVINPTNNPQQLELRANYGGGRSRRLNLLNDKYN